MSDESNFSTDPETTQPISPRPSGNIRYSWPPPGLEPVQGLFWQATLFLGLGSLILVRPLLYAVARPYPYFSLGPFGDAWWILAVTSLFGLLVLLNALEHLFRFFRHGWKASRHGITVGTLLQVASDRRRDMGFLLQGARAYQGLTDTARGRAAGARVGSALLFLAGALWVTPAFFLGVVLGARGILEPWGLSALTLGPVALLLLGGLFTKALEGTALRSTYRGLRTDPWKVEEVQDSARRWASAVLGSAGGEGTPSATSRLYLGSVLVIVLAVLLALPTFSLTLTNSVGPVLAMVATPSFGATQERAARAEIYRRFRFPADTTITPLQAGQALQSLTSAGERREQELMLPPARRYEEKLLAPDAEERIGIPAHEWPERLFGKVVEGLSPPESEFLAEVAAHPALQEFRVLSKASAADVLQARYQIPFPEGTNAVVIPIPRFATLREGGYAMVGRAAHQLAERDREGAEETLRELISAGFLLGEEGVTLIDNLIGYVLVETGGQALEGLYRATGRVEDAGELARTRATTERAVELAGSDRGREGIEAALAKMPGIIQSQEATRGLRWEYFLVLNGVSPCLNANKVVFGPDQEFQDFLASAREALVRYPSEAAYFDLLQDGWFGYEGEESAGRFLGRLVGLTLGGAGTPGSCASLLAHIQW